MNYQLHYQRLMDRSKGRTLVGYSEKHHIVPRCLGGGDEKENIAVLTAEEHYVAHLLLIKIHPGHKGLIWSAMQMTNGNRKQERSGNKRYGWLRRRFAEMIRKSQTGRKATAETRAKQSAARLGKKTGPRSEATKLKMSQSSRGRKKSAEHCAALAAAKLGKKGPERTPEWRANQREGIIRSMAYRDDSFKNDPAYKAGQAAKMREIWERRRLGLSPMPRHAT